MSRVLDLWAGMTGTVLDFGGSAAPTGWLLCYGQAISRATYAPLFAAIGTTFGVGDGSTTFNLPDCRGRVHAGKDDMGGTAAARIVTLKNGTTTNVSPVITGLTNALGDLVTGMSAVGPGIPAGATVLSIDSTTQVTLSANATASANVAIRFYLVDGVSLGAAGGSALHSLALNQIPSHSHNISSNAAASAGSASRSPADPGASFTNTSATAGGGQAHPNLQPTLVLNKIIKT